MIPRRRAIVEMRPADERVLVRLGHTTDAEYCGDCPHRFAAPKTGTFHCGIFRTRDAHPMSLGPSMKSQRIAACLRSANELDDILSRAEPPRV